MVTKNQVHSEVFFPKWGQAACMCLLMVVAQATLANPTGGKVTAGNATISNSGTTTTIKQSSNKAIINWNSFSINPNETTQFLQPSSRSFTLNRVIGGNPSQILGHMSANGTVYLINANGILFGKNAVVDVGGLVASTANISDKQFMSNGPQNFTLSPSGASIINEGDITVKDAGIAVLVAPTVINDGIISANLGTVALASGDHFTLDLYGDNLISFDAGKAMSKGIVENSGLIQANGGKVLVTAQAADALVSNTINMDGIIEAKTVSNKNGKVILQGYDNSTVNVSGKIDVSGKKSGETGGVIQATGTTVNLKNGSVLDASGNAGGGVVNIGGELHGGGNLSHAQYVNMDNGATITADALQKGNGGLVTLWSDQNTNAYGSISARGGAQSGNGGLIETSSHNTLGTAGAIINAGAANGIGGTWLLDPVTLTVLDSDAAGYNTSLAAGTNVAIQTTDGILFNNFTTPISWGTTASFSAYSNTAAQSITSDPNTITFTGCGAGQCQINSTGSGAINLYYNPTAYVTPTNFAANVTGPLTAYMEVNNPTELNQVSTNLAGDYALNASINAASLGNFTPIGTSGTPFTGIFTGNILGNQFTISNLTSNQVIPDVGLFGYVTGELDSIFLNNANITGNMNVGAVAGQIAGGTINGQFNVTNSTISGSGVLLGGFIGGVIGNFGSGTVGANTTITTDSATTVTGTVNNGGAGGLFGLLQPTTYLTFNDFTNHATVNTTGTQAGGIAGEIASFASITNNLINTGDVSGGLNRVGGIAGTISAFFSGTSSNSGNISGTDQVGGMAGFAALNSDVFSFTNNGTITGTNNYTGGVFGQTVQTLIFGTMVNNGNVNGVNFVGGIAGDMDSASQSVGTLTNNATVTGTNDVGGIVGHSAGMLNFHNFDNGNVVGNSGSNNVGGIVGDNSGTITDSLVKATISGGSGSSNTGGIAGNNSGNINQSTVVNSKVSGSNAIGGIVGNATGASTIQNVSFTGSVSGGSNVGAIAGVNAGSVQYALGVSTVSGSSNLGALIGDNSLGTISNSFYDTTLSGSLPAVGLGSTGPGVIGSTPFASTNPLSVFTTYTNNGFSAGTWQLIPGNYASLIWCGSSCTTAFATPPVPANVVTQQIVNAISSTPSGVPLSTETVVETSASGIVSDSTMLTSDATDFLDGTFVLQGLDGMSTQETSDPNYVKHSISDTVKALQKARGCAIKK